MDFNQTNGINEVRTHKTGAPDVIQSSDGRLTLSVPIQI